jgi:TPR repeat protein
VYLEGSAGVTDYDKAFELFTDAAKQGSVQAVHHLGIMYEYGVGVQQDFKQAAKHYKVAANRVRPCALLFLLLLNS